MKWFPKAHATSDAAARETPVLDLQHDTASEVHRRPRQSRLSSTFGDSRPWNLMPLSQPAELDLTRRSSSRKRRSFFGGRGSNSSIIQAPLESTSHRPSSPIDLSTLRDVGSDRPISSKSNTSMSGRTSRASRFSSRTSSRLMRAGENISRYSNSFRSSFSFHQIDADDDDACGHAHFGSGYLGNQTVMDRATARRSVSKRDISRPFDFVHVSHTQRSQIPKFDELDSQTWDSSPREAPKAGVGPGNIDKQRSDSGLYQTGGLGCAQMEATLASLRCERELSPDTVSDSLPLNAFSPQSDGDVRSSSIRQSNFQSNFSDLRLLQMRGDSRGAPVSIHPAFRASSISSAESRSVSNASTYEGQIKNLDSVPEEMENPSPARRHEDMRTFLDAKPLPSPPGSASSATPICLLFPTGNAFVEASGDSNVKPDSLEEQESFDADDSLPSLTSGDTWENEVDLLYLAEAESTCDFDWASFDGSSGTQDRRDSGATASMMASSKHHSARSERSSTTTSQDSVHDDGMFAGFDGVTLSIAASRAHKPANARNVSNRHSTMSAISTSNAELSTIQELACAGSQSGSDSCVDTPICASPAKHVRAASFSDQKPTVLTTTTRWSIASPLYLPKDAKLRRPSFTSNATGSFAGQMLFGAPLFPPPAMPLPEVPAVPLSKRNSVLPTPPMSPPMLYEPEFTYMRRPACAQDRALLQAAGRTVQRGRQGQNRPSTPSCISDAQAMSSIAPEARSMVHMHPAFPTPPTSPPQHFEPYPAWI